MECNRPNGCGIGDDCSPCYQAHIEKQDAEIAQLRQQVERLRADLDEARHALLLAQIKMEPEAIQYCREAMHKWRERKALED